MPHRRLEIEERPGKGAHHRGRGKGTEPKDSTGSAARNRAVGSTPEERKSGWVRLSDLLVAPDGLEVKRHATDDELRLFLGRAEVAA